jgi:hypothetical protein
MNITFHSEVDLGQIALECGEEEGAFGGRNLTRTYAKRQKSHLQSGMRLANGLLNT